MDRFSLSPGAPPRSPGYSQSMSIPSKFLSRKNFIADMMNSFLLSGVDTIFVKGLLPAVHPPIEIRVFSAGFSIFISFTRSNLETNKA